MRPHARSFVPADSAVVGVVDAVYARVVSTESVCRGQSAFLTDLTQVCRWGLLFEQRLCCLTLTCLNTVPLCLLRFAANETTRT